MHNPFYTIFKPDVQVGGRKRLINLTGKKGRRVYMERGILGKLEGEEKVETTRKERTILEGGVRKKEYAADRARINTT